jgi:hypothetical protein
MRTPPAAAAVPLVVLSLLAGCSGGDGGGTSTDTGTDGQSTHSPTTSASDPQERFAVLVAEGLLQGEGPPEGDPKVACSISAPTGAVDADAGTLWAQAGRHSFQAGKTWIVVLDRVGVDDPRGGSNGCRVPASARPFVGEALWRPQLSGEPFHVRVHAGDGDDLLVGRAPVAPDDSLQVQVTFEDGEYTFTGELTFSHAGWWPNAAFGERDEDAPMDGTAVWWG